MVNIAIVGAGVVGLSTALNIQQRLPAATITVFADKFGNETTSIGAGGLFRPNAQHIHGVNPDTVKRWSKLSFNHYSSYATSAGCQDTGHMILPGYVLSNTEVKDPLYKEIVYSFRELTPSELKALGVTYKYGYQVTTVVTDMTRYLPWLMNKFKESGGLVVNKTISSLKEFIGKYDLVVNCSAIGSRALVGDTSVYPVRGHLIKARAPWIKYWLYTEDSAYFIPSFDGLSMGGIRQRDNYNMEVDPRDTQGILERCQKVWPALKGATIIRDWVNLRPHRDPIRLEREHINFDNGSIEVVHNYGHGASGVTLSWGTAVDAANLVVEALSNTTAKL